MAITWDHIRKGVEKLDKIFEKADYEEKYSIESVTFSKGTFFRYIHNGIPIIRNRASSTPEKISPLLICEFARKVYDKLCSEEKDEREISNLSDVWGFIRRLKDERIFVPDDILPAYLSAQKATPNALTFELRDFPKLSDEELDKAVQKISDYLDELKVGSSVYIEGTQNLTRLAWQAGLKKIFKYEFNHYCTLDPETHQFKRDLESAVQYELLSQAFS